MKPLRIVSFVTLVNAVVVGSGLIFEQPHILVIYGGVSAMVALVTQIFAFIGTLEDK